MKYKDFPKIRLLDKLMATSFSSPSKNNSVFMWCQKAMSTAEFVENERVKLIKKYGQFSDGAWAVKKEKFRDFAEEFEMFLNSEALCELPPFPLESVDFSDDQCFYPPEKELWINPKDLNVLVQIGRAGD